MLLISFELIKRNYLMKYLEEIAFNTRLKIEEHMRKFVDTPTHEENVSQLLQTNNKQF